MNTLDLTDEELAASLENPAAPLNTTIPKSWRGRPLGEFSRGLRTQAAEIIGAVRGDNFHDVALLTLLCDAYGETKEDIRRQRVRIQLLSESRATFMTDISLLMDEMSDEDLIEANRIVHLLFKRLEDSRVQPVPEKKISEPS